MRPCLFTVAAAAALAAGLAGHAHAQGVLLNGMPTGIAKTVPLAAGQVLVGQGATVDPAATTISGEATLSSAGAVTLGSRGTWTPVIAGSTTAGTATYTTQVGSYEVLGRTVIARFDIVTSALSGGSGNATITGLPVTAANTTGDAGTCTIAQATGVTTDSGYTAIAGVVSPNTAVVTLYENGSNKTGQPDAVGNLAAATTLVGTCIYHQ